MLKLLKFKKENFFKKETSTKNKTESNRDLNQNLNIKKFKKYSSFKINIKNSKENIIDKKAENNNMKNGMNEKMKKRIIVIKKQKKLSLYNNINNDEFNSGSLTERKNEENYNENKYKRLINFESNKNEKHNDNLAIFEIISNTKIKSMIEYEEEKEKEKEIEKIRINTKILKENFNANNNYDINELNLIMKKNDSKDTFSFRPTNNDSRLILEQDMKKENEFINKDNENDIFLEFSGNPLKSKEKQRIKIIKKQKKKLCK